MSDAIRTSSLRAANECTAACLRRATRAVTAVYDELMHATGLRSTQFSLLNAIFLAQEPSVSRLAELLELDRTTLTRNLRPLERDGLVKAAQSHDDGRVRIVQLTAKGQRSLAAALPAWTHAQETIEELLGRSDWRDLMARLDDVTARVSKSS